VTKKNDRLRVGVSRQRWFGLFMVAALAVGGDALAIERCVGEHGEAMFTQNCPGTVAAPRQRVSGRGAAVAAPATAGGFCARTPQQLEQQVRSALATRNGVRLSGLALWRGVSARAARSEARELLRLLKAGSASVALEAASADPARESYGHDRYEQDPYDHDGYARDSVPPARPPSPALIVMPVTQRQGFTHSEQLRFDIVRDHGCYWLSPRPQRIFDEPLQTVDRGIPDNVEPVALRGR
jgi:hypothetical protein